MVCNKINVKVNLKITAFFLLLLLLFAFSMPSHTEVYYVIQEVM